MHIWFLRWWRWWWWWWCILCVYSYVGNLDPAVTEELLVTLFTQLGSCKGCKIIHEVIFVSAYCWDSDIFYSTNQAAVEYLSILSLIQFLLTCQQFSDPVTSNDTFSLASFTVTLTKGIRSASLCLNIISIHHSTCMCSMLSQSAINSNKF